MCALSGNTAARSAHPVRIARADDRQSDGGAQPGHRGGHGPRAGHYFSRRLAGHDLWRIILLIYCGPLRVVNVRRSVAGDEPDVVCGSAQPSVAPNTARCAPPRPSFGSRRGSFEDLPEDLPKDRPGSRSTKCGSATRSALHPFRVSIGLPPLREVPDRLACDARRRYRRRQGPRQGGGVGLARQPEPSRREMMMMMFVLSTG
jgi:hypothetical protein